VTVFYRRTPLMLLVKSNAPITSQLEIARLLLAANCNVNQETQDGVTALVIACGHCRTGDEMIRLLIKHSARVTPRASFTCFHYQNDRSSFAVINCLLEHGMDINATDKNGRTAIHWAAEKHNTNLVRLLLDHNADVSIQDGSGQTALMEACLNIL